MNAFPLAPFLESLNADRIRVTLADYDRIAMLLRAGGPWTLERLRGALLALLVSNQDDEQIFLQRFDSFFDLELKADAEVDDETIEQAVHAISHFRAAPDSGDADGRPADRGGAGQAGRVRRVRQDHIELTPWQRLLAACRRNLARTLWVGAACLVLAAACALWATYPQWRERLWPATQPGTADVEEPIGTTQPSARFTVNAVVSPLEKVASEGSWWDYVGVGIVAALVFLALYLLFRLLTAPPSEERPPDFDPEGPQHFPRSEVGGKPAAQLDDVTLTHLADSLGFFRSETPGRVLDVEATVEAVVERGGLPSLVFHRRKHLRTVLVMEDAFAEALEWNTVPRELAEGLARRGVPVMHGNFNGVPSAFQAEGHTHWLDDLDNNRSDYLLLIFSDGKGVSRRDSLVLEALARWPMVAWMELREPRLWDESTARIARHGIPVYPATAEGLLQVTSRFLTERGAGGAGNRDWLGWRGAPAFVGGGLASYVERLLGDSLLWAQACAMIQPVTLGLADALRRRFQPHLPPGRVGRLMQLPGTVRSVAGIKFSNSVLAALRSGFAARWPEGKQEEILTFILEKLHEVEPEAADSLAHLAWESAVERVRLELEPEAASRRLAQLDKTPLHHFIRAELENVILPGAGAGREERDVPLVPLRVAPRDDRALLQLSTLADKIEPPPVLSRLKTFLKLLRLRIDGAFDFVRRYSDFLPISDASLNSRTMRAILERKIEQNGDSRLKRFILKALNTYTKALHFSLFPPGVWVLWRRLGRITSPLFVYAPHSLNFGLAQPDSRKHKRLTLVNAGKGLITVSVASGCDWVTVMPSTFPVVDEQRVAVEVSTAGMLPGRHTAEIRLDTSEGVRHVPVEVTVFSFNWRAFLPWRGLSKQAALRWLSLGAVFVVSALWALPSVLPPNWVNALYNAPPEVQGINALSEGGSLRLQAVASDPEKDSLAYRWQLDTSPTAVTADVMDLDFSGRDPSTIPPAVNVRLTVEDSRGGNSVYVTNVAIAYAMLEDDDPVDPKRPDEETVGPTVQGSGPAQQTGPTTRPTADGNATLIVVNEQGALVRIIDPKYQILTRTNGKTAALKLPPGTYHILASKNGYKIASIRVVLARPNTTVRTEISLTPSDWTAGTLLIPQLNPGVIVRVEGKTYRGGEVGRTQSVTLPAGQYIATFFVRDLPAGSAVVNISSGETTTLTGAPITLPLSLSFSVNDVRVVISSQGRTVVTDIVRQSSLVTYLPAGRYQISAKKAGYKDYTTSVEMDSSQSLSIRMERADGSSDPSPTDAGGQGADFQPARLTSSNVRPYPPNLGSDKPVRTTVSVRVNINARGVVTAAQALDGDVDLRSAAESTAKTFMFTPAMRRGGPATDVQTVTVVFQKVAAN